jgi:hypothetical protein
MSGISRRPFFPGKKQVEFLPHGGAAVEYALCAGPFPEYRWDVEWGLKFRGFQFFLTKEYGICT